MLHRLPAILTLLLTLVLCTCVSAQTNVLVKVDEEGGERISRHIYGHFAEHLGRSIYGGFYVGEKNEEIPNTDGVRNDIIAALRDLDIPNLRWPGGCFADTYHWKDGIGPREDRPTIVNQWWGGATEDNSFGTHDFLNLCELLDAEPYLSVNVGSGTVREAEEWLQYTTHDGVSPMAELRRKNGREEPWKVRFWGVGNEAWGCGGNMTPDYYANIYRQYATYMRDWNPGDSTPVVRIASGASSDDYGWTEALMKNIKPGLVEALAVHHYTVIDWNNKGPSVEFEEERYFKSMRKAIQMDQVINRHDSIMDIYDPEQRVAIYVDEWGGWYDAEPDFQKGVLYQQNTMRDAMIAGTTLNIFNNHCDRVRMANLAQTVNVLQSVILTEGNKMLLTPTYHVMRMYKVHQDALLLPVELSDEATYGYEGDTLPAISVSASRDKRGRRHVSLVNIAAHDTHTVRLDMAGLAGTKVSGEILGSGKLQDYNGFGAPEKIVPKLFTDFSVGDGLLSVVLPPFSVVVLEIVEL